MPTDFERACFEDELVRVQGLVEAGRWKLARDDSVPLGLTAEMHSLKAPTELYLARVRWEHYFEPASVKFLNRETSADNDPRAWPQCAGFRPTSLDTCVNWTREGHLTHPEWAQSPHTAFAAPEAPMQFVLLHLQMTLDTTYSGRGAP